MREYYFNNERVEKLSRILFLTQLSNIYNDDIESAEAIIKVARTLWFHDLISDDEFYGIENVSKYGKSYEGEDFVIVKSPNGTKCYRYEGGGYWSSF